MITLITTTVTWESGQLVLFQPLLKAYPMCHSCIITAHVSLGNLEKQWKMFITQMERTQCMNRQHINVIIDRVERTHVDITTLYNITSSLYNSLSYQHIILYVCSILANL